jgi:hypothetical protein
MFDEGLLDRMEVLRCAEALDCQDVPLPRLDGQHHAGVHRFAVDEDSARAALPLLTRDPDAIHAEPAVSLGGGGLFVLTMHPQVTGRPSRIEMLADLVSEMKGHDGVWIANCRSIVDEVARVL